MSNNRKDLHILPPCSLIPSFWIFSAISTVSCFIQNKRGASKDKMHCWAENVCRLPAFPHPSGPWPYPFRLPCRKVIPRTTIVPSPTHAVGLIKQNDIPVFIQIFSSYKLMMFHQILDVRTVYGAERGPLIYVRSYCGAFLFAKGQEDDRPDPAQNKFCLICHIHMLSVHFPE